MHGSIFINSNLFWITLKFQGMVPKGIIKPEWHHLVQMEDILMYHSKKIKILFQFNIGVWSFKIHKIA